MEKQQEELFDHLYQNIHESAKRLGVSEQKVFELIMERQAPIEDSVEVESVSDHLKRLGPVGELDNSKLDKYKQRVLRTLETVDSEEVNRLQNEIKGMREE